MGLRTYPLGFFARTVATLSRLKIYRSAGTGLFIHISSNLQIEDSLFADNGIAIDLERSLSPPMLLKNVTIIGETASFLNNVRRKGHDTVCSDSFGLSNHSIGVEIRTWKNEVGSTGSVWEDVKFSRFDRGSCKYSTPISLDYTVNTDE
jgi:hypothetical protein